MLTCSLCEKRRERFPREVTMRLLGRHSGVCISASVKHVGVGSRLRNCVFSSHASGFHTLTSYSPPFSRGLSSKRAQSLAKTARSSWLTCRPSRFHAARGKWTEQRTENSIARMFLSLLQPRAHRSRTRVAVNLQRRPSRDSNLMACSLVARCLGLADQTAKS